MQLNNRNNNFHLYDILRNLFRRTKRKESKSKSISIIQGGRECTVGNCIDEQSTETSSALLSIERAILAELIGNHMSNDKIEGAIARNCELQLKKIRRYIYNLVQLFLLDVFLLHGAIVIRTFLVAARRDYICICATIILSSTWQASQRGTDGKLQEAKPFCLNFKECQNVKGTTDQDVECCRH